MTGADSRADPIGAFFEGFDGFRGARTDIGPARAALEDVECADGARGMLPYANLRLPQFSLLGADASSAPTHDRVVANRTQRGYAAARAISDALGRGAVLRVERPDLRSPRLRTGLAGLREAVDDASLAIFELRLEPSRRILRFACDRSRYLVTQRAGVTEWLRDDRTPGSEPDRLGPGASRYVGQAGTGGGEVCAAVEPSTLLVMAYALPGPEQARRALASDFLSHLDDIGDGERHHLVGASDKVQWLLARLHSYLDTRWSQAGRLNLLGPASDRLEISVAASVQPPLVGAHGA